MLVHKTCVYVRTCMYHAKTNLLSCTCLRLLTCLSRFFPKRRRRRCCGLCRGMRGHESKRKLSHHNSVRMALAHAHMGTRTCARCGGAQRTRPCDARSSPPQFLLNFVRTYFYFTLQVILDNAMKSIVAYLIQHISIKSNETEMYKTAS